MSLRAATTLTASSGLDALRGTNADGTAVSWMQCHWPFVSWAAFLFGAGFLAAHRRRHGDDNWRGWLAFVAYCLHQSEEHAYDVRGWRYSFVPALNGGPVAELYGDLCAEFGEGAASPADGVVSCPLDPKITLWINTVLIWGGFGGCMVLAEVWPSRFLLAGYLNWGAAVVNGIGGHILPAILTRSYNPGVVQSVLMVPLGIRLILASGFPALCLANGIICHLALALGVNIVFRFKTDEAITMSVLMWIAGLAVPLGISNVASQRGRRSRGKRH